MLTVRIPFGRGGCRGGSRLSALGRRMVTPIVRDVDIITNAGLGNPEPARFARTGELISNAVTIDGNTADPESDIEGAGANSLVIADGSAGTILPADTSDMNVGQVIMGGGSGLAVVGANTGTTATFNAPGTRGTLQTNDQLINAADDGCLLGLDLLTTGTNDDGIVLNDDTNFLIDDVNITTGGSLSEGITASGNSQFTLNNSTITTDGSSSEGIIASGNSLFTLNNSTITTDGTSSEGIQAFNNSQFTLNNSTITTNGTSGEGIDAGDNTQFTINNSEPITTKTSALFNIFDLVRDRTRTNTFEQRGDTGGMAQARTVVDIVGTKAGTHQLLE